MTSWGNVYFMDACSSGMEHMLFFHDHSMIVIISVLFFLMSSLMMMILIKKINLNLMENQFIEMIWTFIPMILLMFIALPSLRLLYLMEEGFSSSMSVKVLGHQWYWSYEYAELGVSFDSFLEKQKYEDLFRLLETDSYLFLPLDTKIRFLVSSSDVIHSWAVQSLGIKIDAIPGRLNQVNVLIMRPGTFLGQCSEICGMSHSLMPITISVMNMEDFIDCFF